MGRGQTRARARAAVAKRLDRIRCLLGLFAGVVAAAACFPTAAVAQLQATAQRGHGVVGTVRVRNLDATPPISRAEIGRHPQPLAPLTGVSPAEYESRKSRAEIQRFAPNGDILPPPTPAPRFGAPLTPTAGHFT